MWLNVILFVTFTKTASVMSFIIGISEKPKISQFDEVYLFKIFYYIYYILIFIKKNNDSFFQYRDSGSSL